MHMYYFYRVTLMENGVAAIFKRTDKPKVPLPSKLNSLSESFNTLCSSRSHTLPYLCHNTNLDANTHTLELAPSCNFMHI